MIKQGLQQKLLQKLTPQQIQLIKLVELPLLELEQRIKQEIEENPALEEINNDEQYESEENNNDDDINNNDDEFSFEDYCSDEDYEIPAYKMNVSNVSKDDKQKEYIYTSTISFQESLNNQLAFKDVTEREKFIGEFLIGNIDDSGYLRRELDAMVDDIAFTQNVEVSEDELIKVLSVIQELDPAGVGARTLKECLLLQLKRKKNPKKEIILAEKILEKNFEAFGRKHYSKIMARLNINETTLKSVINIILKLNPKPGNSYSEQYSTTTSPYTITPDFIMEINNGEIDISLNSRNLPDVKISKDFSKMLEEYSRNKKRKENKEAAKFIRQKLESARVFIDAISQRQNTLLVTMHSIVELQKEFFITGDETNLKPMILKNVSDFSGLDISTISRVANSKYVATPYGNYQLKYFFSEGLKTDTGEEVSTTEIKQILKDCITQEDKLNPLTDHKLTEILKSKGYNIARRTIAKYREQLDIPVARLRKEL